MNAHSMLWVVKKEKKNLSKQYGAATSAPLKASQACVRLHNVLLYCDFGTDDSVKVVLFNGGR